MGSIQDGGLVVVGIDESPEADGALHYAVSTAAARGLALLVVHGYTAPPMDALVTEEVMAAVRRSAQMLVDRAISRVVVPKELRVATVVEPGLPLPLLRCLAEQAALVVVGQHHFRLPGQLPTGAVASPLAATAPCPVAVVPRRRNELSDPSTDGIEVRRPIVVAVDGETPAAAALDFAFEEAERVKASVIALHAAPLHDLPSFTSEDRSNIGEILAGAKQDHPDIAVSMLLLPGEPDERIVDASLWASLVVVGRPHRQGGWRPWTRSVARAVIVRSACPLVVVPQVVGSFGAESVGASVVQRHWPEL